MLLLVAHLLCLNLMSELALVRSASSFMATVPTAFCSSCAQTHTHQHR